MQNFIVLGFIPGTEIQITFTGWLLVFSGLTGAALLLRSRRTIRNYLLGIYLSHLVKNRQIA